MSLRFFTKRKKTENCSRFYICIYSSLYILNISELHIDWPRKDDIFFWVYFALNFYCQSEQIHFVMVHVELNSKVDIRGKQCCWTINESFDLELIKTLPRQKKLFFTFSSDCEERIENERFGIHQQIQMHRWKVYTIGS